MIVNRCYRLLPIAVVAEHAFRVALDNRGSRLGRRLWRRHHSDDTLPEIKRRLAAEVPPELGCAVAVLIVLVIAPLA